MKVELLPAFHWTCEECGRSHFGRAIAVPDEEAREILEDEGVTEEDFEEFGGSVMAIPDVVSCEDCGASFETLYYGEEVREEDE